MFINDRQDMGPADSHTETALCCLTPVKDIRAASLMNQMAQSNSPSPQPRQEEGDRISEPLARVSCPQRMENRCRQTAPRTQSVLSADQKKHLEQKLQRLRGRIQETHETSLKNQKQHEQILQLAHTVFEQAKAEQKVIENIEKDQKSLDQQSEIISNRLIAVKERMAHLKHEQEEVRWQTQAMRQASSEVPLKLNLLESEFACASESLAQVTMDQKNVQRQHKIIQREVQTVRDEQEHVQSEIHAQMMPAQDEEQEVSHGDSNHQSAMDRMTKSMEQHQAFDKKGSRFRMDLVSEKLSNVWGEVRKKTHFTPLSVWSTVTHETINRLQAISEIAKERISASQGWINGAVMWSLNRGWTYLKEKLGFIAWIALGILGTCLFGRIAASYPVVSLLIGACVFFVFRDQF